MADQRDIGHRPPGALFSMEAADNAEVVPTDLPRGQESMWSTEANPEEADEVTGATATAQPQSPPPVGGWWSSPPTAPGHAAVDDDAAWAQMGSPVPPGSTSARAGAGFGVGRATDPWAGSQVPPTAAGAPGAGGVFSAEPVERTDVIDEDEVDGELEDDWSDPVPASLFSSGPSVNGNANANGNSDGSSGRPAPASPFGDAATSGAAGRGAGPFAAPNDPWNAWDHPPQDDDDRPVTPPPPFAPPAAAPTEMPRAADGPANAIAADQHGLDVAVSRLRAEDQERARVPLSVCGALLEPGEQVLGAVTGQMLGRPAAVVVTRTRVLVVNDRRWQPIVDIYPIDGSLLVRGRHDRQVAALSFADDERLSMVDGITEVEIAIGLADAIRDPGMADRGSGSAF